MIRSQQCRRRGRARPIAPESTPVDLDLDRWSWFYSVQGISLHEYAELAEIRGTSRFGRGRKAKTHVIPHVCDAVASRDIAE